MRCLELISVSERAFPCSAFAAGEPQSCMHANHKFGVHALYVHIDRLVTRELWTFKFQFMNRCGWKLHIMIESLKYPCQCICCCLQGLYPEQPCAST